MDSQERDPGSPRRAAAPSLSDSTQPSKYIIQQGLELWELVEEPQGRLGTEGTQPERQEGHLLKKRKWPLKGWHKRYFVLEDGILRYANTRQDIAKGKLHGSIDVRSSVMSINKKAQRIDLDTEDNIYHLKIKSQELFQSWVARLCAHRMAQRPDMARCPKLPASSTNRKVNPRAEMTSSAHLASTDNVPALGSRDKVSSWLKDSEGLDRCSHGGTQLMFDNCGHDGWGKRTLKERKTRSGSWTWSRALTRLGWGWGEPGICIPEGAGVPPRRRCLPAASGPGTDVSLWNILRNNIGKDLSKVSMPVQLNEPLNTLQRLCEELEYSNLLDQASRTPDPCERMLYIAAFAVSAYSSTYHRAGCKPFNPVLGETYECERPDRGFRFISEQVSHHPPISACHAESDNFIFWQDMKWKNKFWGKSLEIVPVGTVNVRLPRFGDHFEWNKVTSCIHNILSGQRWIEHYGEVLIRNTQDSSCHCKITFCKAKYWSSSVHEVQGAVFSKSGRVIHRLFGKWHEGLYRGPPPGGQCIWKPNLMPQDHERNFGFTQFALELNELTAELKRSLPSTDTRLRPDQRYLEEGNIQAAESQKRRIEQLQRDRRKVMEENNITHQARFFRRQTDGNGKEWWVTNNTYWRLRAEPGYGNLDGAVLW
ncbi:oxysterol-binding protein-related protein 7 [Gracilinanus agilis]|uniref:oxysterol-binding protein-related protein 7 n=1 Tax=Gracilinanus agilis TaxID=191870 RepID=UPI001CFD7806|nr:oxysterol-binding protein-related protein 7 [Gracilinanus agilis]